MNFHILNFSTKKKLNSVSIMALTLVNLSIFSNESLARKGSKGTSTPLSSGIAFSSPSDSVFLNPAGLVDGSIENFRGLWLGDTQEPMLHLTGSSRSLGWGLGYLRTSAGGNFTEGSVGFNLSNLKFGLGVYSTDFDGLDGNIGLNMDLSKVRLAFVGRGISGRMDRLDFGLGFYGSTYRFEFDVKKPNPFDAVTDFFDLLLLDAGLTLMADPLNFSFGLDTNLNSGTLGDLNFHAGIDFLIGKRMALQAHYRPWAAERGGNEWAAGIRALF